LISTTSIPRLRAFAAIRFAFPPWARFTYQIHIPSPRIGFDAGGVNGDGPWAPAPGAASASTASAAAAAAASAARVRLEAAIVSL
jgi:hypothetical protein